MKKFLLSILICLPLLAQAQRNPYSGEVRVGFDGYTLSGKNVTFHAAIDLSGLDLPKNEMLTFTPMLRSADGTHEYRFDPVVVTGRERDKLIRRAGRFEGYAFDPQPQQYIVLTRVNPRQQVGLNLTAPYEKWMRGAYLLVTEQASGCAGGNLLYADGLDAKAYSGDPYRFPEPYTPVFEVVYLTPEVEAVKIRQDTYSARLQFKVNQTTLLPEFGSNAQVLAETREVIQRVKNDPLLEVREITVQGYASPEGHAEANYQLSQGRAQAFVDYLHRQDVPVSRQMISAQGMGEDWNGLRDAVAGSDLHDREKVLGAIDAIGDIARRKNTLKGLSGGETYRVLLEDFYPPLRRNEYTISYEVRGFNAQEAKELLRTRPQLLSLNEMFMVAEGYSRDSQEFKEVFDIAARLYPDSPVARFNVAAMEIENGSYDTAISRLDAVNSPEAWNNLGIAYWQQGRYEQAESAFRKAADAGFSPACANLEQFQRWAEERE